ncbi:MAG: HAD family hydrolase [Ardenticatenia bacterium]|nr:MAG: HAD family hydrolase [Ardenticatenia bacterium]
MPIRAVIFDVGGTLIYPVVDPLRILHDAGFAIEPHVFSAALRRTFNEHFWPRTGRDLDMWGDDDLIRTYWREFYAHLFSLLGLPKEAWTALADRIQDHYWQPDGWTPFPETHTVLEQLKTAGFILGALSDWNSQLPRILDHLDLHAYFDFVVVSALHGVGKPSPLLFDIALRRSGVRAEEAIYVGDTYMTDIMGARASGLHPVLIDRSQRPAPADCDVIRSLDELLPLLRRLNGREEKAAKSEDTQ